LALEVVRARLDGRAPEVEPPEALSTGGADRFPVQEHVWAERKVLFQTRRPWHHQRIFERQRHETTDGRTPEPDEDDPRAIAELLGSGAQKSDAVDWRSQVAHAGREHGVEIRQVLGASGFNGESVPLGSPYLIAHISVEATPQAIGLGNEIEAQNHFVLLGLDRNRQAVRAADLDDPCADPACL